MSAIRCRFCGAPLTTTFVDLGMSPLCESYLSADQLDQMEPFYPLHVQVCSACLLVQLQEYVSPERIFSEYAYFSSYADTWVEHAKAYSEEMMEQLGLDKSSQVVEVGSNDGYLLRNFVQKGIPSLGIEPARNVAKDAIGKGIPTQIEFFGVDCARRLVNQGKLADLIVANNVLAQVNSLNDFVEGLRLLLKPEGIITIEFPHVMRLVANNQFDTIYHEHFSYFSLISSERVLRAHALVIFDVQELPTHGGSLRIYACHATDATKTISERVARLRAVEQQAGLEGMAYYQGFGDKVNVSKRKLLGFLIEAKREGKSIVGYGAPGKGNTLLNFCGIRTDFLDYTVDRNPYKQNKYLPGTHIPIFPPDQITVTRPDYLLILPWNLRDEIIRQNAFIREWGGQFVVPIPEVEVYP